uniref:Uncharacterized protein n=1 Tax=Arundo donax TaxID=35708 RepID=A0A0A9D168_ARUDO
MSCLSRHDGDHHHAPPPALDLLDEYWFFSNTLVVKNNKAAGRKPPLLPRSPSTSTADKAQQHGGGTDRSRFHESGCRRLLRTPSLPSPRVGMMEEMPNKQDDDDLVEEEAGGNQQAGAVEVDDDDLNWSSIYEGVLRTRIAAQGTSTALHRAPSMPVPSSAMDHDHEASATMSMPRLRHSYSTLDRQQQCRMSAHTPTTNSKSERASGGRCEVRSLSANQQQQPMAVVRSKSCLFQDKKWKSSSDLESIEVQGFRDLGFVFDKEELRENLADVLPGLRGSATVDKVRRPYLSEAWHHVQRSAAPALIRVQSSDARSAAEMKDQLRMWAQAVACNVRQDC